MKGNKIMSATSEYLRQRSFEGAIEIKREKEDSFEEQSDHLSEEHIGLKELISPSSPNSFTFSTTSSHYNFIDQQYIRLRSWMTEASEPCRSELSQILFPLFVHLYLELLSGAGKQAAKIFFNRHYQVFRVNRDYEQTLKQVLSAAGEAVNSPTIQSWKSGKHPIRLSELTLNYFLRFLQTSNNPTLLQIFNNFLEVELSEGSGCQTVGAYRGHDDREDESKFLSEVGHQGREMDCSQEELNRVREVIANVRNTRPLMPSLCVYSVHNAYNGLTCSRVNRDSRLLMCGFEDSVIKLWRLTAPNSVDPESEPPSGPQSSESILFCDFAKGDDSERSPGAEKEEEEEIKCTGGRHVSGGEFCTLRGHRGSVFDAAFTHCSSYLLSVGDDAAMRLWDLKQRRTVALYQGHHYPVWCVDVSPHSIYIATGSYDESIRLWTTECTYPLRAFIGHTGSVDSVAFHPNCSYVASGSHDRSVRLWQINEASIARILLHHTSPVKALKFSPDGKHLASGSETGEVLIWDLVAGKVAYQVGGPASSLEGASAPFSSSTEDPIVSLDWSKDSRVLFSASSEGSVRGVYFNGTEVNETIEIGNVSLDANSCSSSLTHMSLNNHNYLSAVIAVHGER